jgi:hypothetical protein
MDAKSLIAWLALGISAATFVWKFVETYIRWPHIGVVMRQSITIFPAHFHVAVGETDVVTIRGGTPLASVFPDENPAQNETASSELSDAASNHPPHRPTEDRFHLIVVNSGAEATTIANVGIRSEDGTRRIDVEQRRDDGAEIQGPDLPGRVESHGALHWIIGHDETQKFPRGTPLVGYAYRYKTFRKYPKSRRNPLKIYETKVTYHKN